MKTLKFEIDIAADPKKVWNTMLQRPTYEQWTRNAWPTSSYTGEFGQGNEVSFSGPDGSGTLATIAEFKPYEVVKAKHIALLGPGGTRDDSSDFAKKWVGIEENYYFKPDGKNTHLLVEIKTNPEWEGMFNEGWSVALKDLKELCEG